MTVTIRAYGNHGPGLEALSSPTTPVDNSQISINSLTSTQVSMSFTLSGQKADLTYTGSFDLSSLGGSTPKTAADLAATQIPNSISTFTLGSGGQVFFSETFSPGMTFNQVSDVTGQGPAMVTALAGNDVYYGAADSTGNSNDSVYLYAGNDTYYANHKLLTKNDLFFGGAGVDTAVLLGKAANYNIKAINYVWNYVTQKSELPGFEITDTTKTTNTLDVNQVERLQFSDTKLALDTGATQSAGQAALLLGAVLPNQLALDSTKQSLVGAVISLFDAGYNLQTLAGALMRLPIWDVLTNKANPLNTDIANYLLNNVNGAAPSSTTLINAALQLAGETGASQGTFLANLAASSAGQTHIGLVGLQATGIAYT